MVDWTNFPGLWRSVYGLVSHLSGLSICYEIFYETFSGWLYCIHQMPSVYKGFLILRVIDKNKENANYTGCNGICGSDNADVYRSEVNHSNKRTEKTTNLPTENDNSIKTMMLCCKRAHSLWRWALGRELFEV